MLNEALANKAIFRDQKSVIVAGQIKFALSYHRIACIDKIPIVMDANCTGIGAFNFSLRRSGTKSLVAMYMKPPAVNANIALRFSSLAGKKGL